MVKFILALLFAAALSQAQAQELWQGAAYGMTRDAVQRQFPTATAPAGKPDTLYGGAVGLLEIPKFALANRTFLATFFFKDDKLSQVMLTLEDPPAYRAAKLLFDELMIALRAKYGNELQLRIRPSALSASADASWVSGRTNIGINLFGVGESPASLNIVYQVRVAQTADKL